MELINRRLLPRGFFDGVRPAASITDVSRRRFATGGAVGGSASVGADVSAPGRAFVLPDEQSVYRMLAAGRAGFLRFYRENAHVLATTNERRPGRRAP
jgi:hypothetical protein